MFTGNLKGSGERPVFNKKLKAKIIEVYGSQGDFAFCVGADETFVSRVVRGRRKLDLKRKMAWSLLLGCDYRSIFL